MRATPHETGSVSRTAKGASWAALLALTAACAHHAGWTPPWTRNTAADEGRILVEGRVVHVAVQSRAEVGARDAGCLSCHEGQEDPHALPAVHLACADCHGGDERAATIEGAHPPRPSWWAEGGANPPGTYTLLNEADLEWVRFVNPGDLRVADRTCGACHDEIVMKVHKSIMTTSSHFWGVVGYVNGITSNKRSLFGESYSPEGVPQIAFTRPAPTEEERARGVLDFVAPLPRFEVGQTGNVFRVFEQGSRLGGVALGLNGLPVPLVGIPDKLEDPGRPNNRLSDRGLGTLNRVDLPLLNLFKTRLNDPFLSFLGTNDQPGDFRSSGCTACHMVYANDRSPVASGPWAGYGNRGHGNAGRDPWGDDVRADPTIAQDEPGHPILHRFTRAIPSSQCLTCHHHQPNAFLNSYLGFTMWAYDADGEAFWPDEQRRPTYAERHEVMLRNPEGAAQSGLWGDPEFLAESSGRNPELRHTQMADSHGHGWLFRGVYRTDRAGNLLDSDGRRVDYADPRKFEGVLPQLGSDARPPFAPPPGKPVHMMDVHAERGMHCVDCHFEQDVHGDGRLYAEYQAAVEITCQDCHGSLESEGEIPLASLRTSGSAAAGGRDLTRGETPFGARRFEVRDGPDGEVVVQRSMLYPELEWDVPQVRRPSERAAAAHEQKAFVGGGLAHGDGKMECYACHTSWVPSCFGCHLPQQANWKTPTTHFEREELRNFSTYNPQVVRDAEFMLGVAGDVKGNRVAPVRSSSALVISSQDAQRQVIYAQVPTIAANGMSSQAFNTHFPHTVRARETRACTDCHVSRENDNNAWLAQVLLLGTKSVSFMGHRVYVGKGRDGVAAVRVSEWDEPQAVIGSRLHELAYPDDHREHVERGRVLGGGSPNDADVVRHRGSHLPFDANVLGLQLRGEYLYTANGSDGFRVLDVANVNNKGFSQKIVTSPVSPLGQDMHVDTKFATAVALPTNNHIAMDRKVRPENRERTYAYRGREQSLHEVYRHAYVADREEGLVVVDVSSLGDFDPRNNFVERVATFDGGGLLRGAVDLTVAGTTVYVCSAEGVSAVDVSDPREPRLLARVGVPQVVAPTSVRVQFRYAFVTDGEGLKVLDVTRPEEMRAVDGAFLPVADARDVYVAKTYAYVSAGRQGLVIADVTRPERPALDQVFDAGGAIDDLHRTRIASTNDSLYAYLADGANGLRILELVSPADGDRSPYAFSPRPRPRLIATFPTEGRAVALSEALDRDRAVDESGNQIAIFGRIGGRPFDLEEMQRLYLREGELWTVSDGEEGPAETPPGTGTARSEETGE